jgi:hypothetical protein
MASHPCDSSLFPHPHVSPLRFHFPDSKHTDPETLREEKKPSNSIETRIPLRNRKKNKNLAKETKTVGEF